MPDRDIGQVTIVNARGEYEHVSEAQAIQRVVSSGGAESFADGALLNMVSVNPGTGESRVVRVPGSKVFSFLRETADAGLESDFAVHQPDISREALQASARTREAHALDGMEWLSAAMGGARALTWGASDIGVRLGGGSDIANRVEENSPWASLGGLAGGMGLGLLAGGPVGALAGAGVRALGGSAGAGTAVAAGTRVAMGGIAGAATAGGARFGLATERFLAQRATALQRLSPGLAATAARYGPGAARLAGAGAEGALGSMMYDVSDVIARNRPLTAENFFSSAGTWAMLGAGFTGALMAGGAGTRFAKNLIAGSAGTTANLTRSGANGAFDAARGTLDDAMGAIRQGQRVSSSEAVQVRTAEALAKLAGRQGEEGAILALMNKQVRQAAGAFERDMAREAPTLGERLTSAMRAAEDATLPIRDSSWITQNAHLFPAKLTPELAKGFAQRQIDGLVHSTLGGITRVVEPETVRALESTLIDLWRNARRTIRGARSVAESYKTLHDVNRTIETIHSSLRGSRAQGPLGDAWKRFRTEMGAPHWGQMGPAGGARNEAFSSYISHIERVEQLTGVRRGTAAGKASKKLQSTLKELGRPTGYASHEELREAFKGMKEALARMGSFGVNPTKAISGLHDIEKTLVGLSNQSAAATLEASFASGTTGGLLGSLGAAVAPTVGHLLGGYPGLWAGMAASRVARVSSRSSMLLSSARAVASGTQGFVERMASARTRLGKMFGSSSRLVYGKASPFSLTVQAFKPGQNRKAQEAEIDAVREEIERLATHPDELLSSMAHSTAAVQHLDPGMADELRKTMLGSVGYLYANLPVRRPDPLRPGKHLPYSTVEMTAFRRKLNALNGGPTYLLDRFMEGKLSMDEVEATRTVLPALYSEQVALLLETSQQAERIPYQLRMQMGIAFGIIDPTQAGDFVLAMNSKFYQTNQQAQAVGATRPMTQPASLEQTPTQALQSR